MAISFGAEKDTAYIRKIMDYVRSKVTFAVVAKKYRLRCSTQHNFCCWIHQENNPSARIKVKGGREAYVCYTGGCVGSADVIGIIQRLEEIKSIAHVIEFMDDHFELNLADNIDAIMGTVVVQTPRDHIYTLSKAVRMDCAQVLLDAFRGVNQEQWCTRVWGRRLQGKSDADIPLPRAGLDPVSRIECESYLVAFWNNLDEVMEMLPFWTVQQAEGELLGMRDEAVRLLERFERRAQANQGLSLEALFGECDGEREAARQQLSGQAYSP